MARLVEFYPEKQGRPDSKTVRDMNTGRVFSNKGSELHTADVDDEPIEGAESVPISSNWAYVHEQEMERKLRILRSLVKSLIRALWDDVDLDDADIDEIEWDEWDW